MERVLAALTAVLLIVSGAACGETIVPPSPSASASTLTPSKSPTKEPSLLTATPVQRPPTEAKVVRIIDGDTVEVDIGGITFQVRYIGIDSPEADDPQGPEATEANRQLVEYETVQLVADISEVDEFDRLLRYVYVGDLFVNAEMVRLGYARAVSYPPNVAHDDLLAEAELQARQAGVGLWAGLAQSATQISVDAGCCQFDAPGNDDENKDQEYVCLRNDGPEAIDLTGYILSDEHGWTYHFGAFTLDVGTIVRVRTGCGEDTASDVYWCHEGTSAIWNNDGDTVFLFSPEGELLLEYSY
jgi:endonuclease YncB( thermonuclease family)